MSRLLISHHLDLLVALRVSIWKLRLLVGIYLLIQVVKLNVSIQAQALLILGVSGQVTQVMQAERRERQLARAMQIRP